MVFSFIFPFYTLNPHQLSNPKIMCLLILIEIAPVRTNATSNLQYSFVN